MGMDLKPMRPSSKAPRYPDSSRYRAGQAIWGRYNWTGWSWLIDHLTKWGVDTFEFDGSNDGRLIKSATCKAVADALEQHMSELTQEEQEWLKGGNDVQLWRTCGGYRQY